MMERGESWWAGTACGDLEGGSWGYGVCWGVSHSAL